MFIKSHEQTIVCLIKLAYQKFDSARKNWYSFISNQKCDLMIIRLHFFKLNGKVRTFIWKLPETSLIRLFTFTNIRLIWLYRWQYKHHIVRPNFVIFSVLYILLFLFLSFSFGNSSTQTNNSLFKIFIFWKTRVQF